MVFSILIIDFSNSSSEEISKISGLGSGIGDEEGESCCFVVFSSSRLLNLNLFSGGFLEAILFASVIVDLPSSQSDSKTEVSSGNVSVDEVECVGLAFGGFTTKKSGSLGPKM